MGTPVAWYMNFNFWIEIDGIVRAAFSTCSEVAAETENVQYSEGGRGHAHNAPGRTTFPEITLERGATDDFDLYNWFLDTYNAASGTGLNEAELYRTFDIVQVDRQRVPVERYTIEKAYCRRFSSGAWDNNANEVRIESVTVQADSFRRVGA